MKKNPGRAKERRDMRGVMKKKGDLTRKSTHQMRTHDGMVRQDSMGRQKFVRTPQGIKRI